MEEYFRSPLLTCDLLRNTRGFDGVDVGVDYSAQPETESSSVSQIPSERRIGIHESFAVQVPMSSPFQITPYGPNMWTAQLIHPCEKTSKVFQLF